MRRAFLLFAAALSFAAPAAGGPARGRAAPAAPRVCVVWDDGLAAAESAFSKSRATNVAALLAEAGLDAPLFPRSSLRKALAAPRRVAHLVLLDGATAADRTALDAFAARGGRVVVHGSWSPVLAAFFGLDKPSAALRPPPGGGDWAGFRLSDPRPANAPAFVANRAAGAPELRAAKKGGASVAARWRTASGTAGPPALFRSPRGFWLVRTLYDDGPAVQRSELLAALSCALDPPLWKDAAAGVEAAALRESGAASWDEAGRRLLRAAPAGRKVLVETLLRAVRARAGAHAALAARGLYGAGRTNLLEAARALARADAAARPLGPQRDGRPFAVWSPSARPPASCGTWDAAAGALARAGVTDLYLWAGSLAVSETPLPGVPLSDASTRLGDPFPDAIRACRARGVRVHAWLGAFRFEGAPPERLRAFGKARRLLHRRTGGDALPWLDPAVASNGADLARAAAALAARDGIAGVHLDFVRYPDAPTREAVDPAAVARALDRVRKAVRKAAPRSALSAAVFSGWPSCVANRGQDWQDWLDRGLIDHAVPMNYDAGEDAFRKTLAGQSRNRSRLVCGIGAGARESWLSPRGLLDRLRLAWARGYAGAAVYAFDDRFVDEFLPVLELAR